MNWQTMTAAERDALVAEKVMGWTRDEAVPSFYNTPEGSRHCTGFDPSDDIAHAFEVVERMRKEFTFEVALRPGDRWFACFQSRKSIGPEGYEHHGKSASDAICLSALRAVGMEIENGN